MKGLPPTMCSAVCTPLSVCLPVNSVGLEELGPMTHGFGVLYDDPDPAAGRAVRNLDPVPAQRRLRGQVHGNGSHTVPGWISVKIKERICY